MSKTLPNLIIAGVNKAGTTSVFSYLAKHPEICPSSIKETCYYLALRYGEILPPLDNYEKHFKSYKGEKYVLEATPGYFYGSKTIPEAMAAHLGKVKIILIFRDPVKRCFSFFRHLKGVLKLDKDVSFESYIEMCENYRKKKEYDKRDLREDNIYWGITGSLYEEHLQDWINVFNNSVKIMFFEKLKEDPKQFCQTICEWLNLDPQIYSNNNFTLENRTIAYRNKLFHQISVITNKKLEKLFRKNPPLKIFLRKIYHLLNEDRNVEQISPEMEAYLNSVFAEPNERLRNLLLKMNYRDLPPWLE